MFLHISVCCAGDVCVLGLEMCLLLCDGGDLAIRPHFGISIIDSARTPGGDAAPHLQISAGCGQLLDPLQNYTRIIISSLSAFNHSWVIVLYLQYALNRFIIGISRSVIKTL